MSQARVLPPENTSILKEVVKIVKRHWHGILPASLIYFSVLVGIHVVAPPSVLPAPILQMCQNQESIVNCYLQHSVELTAKSDAIVKSILETIPRMIGLGLLMLLFSSIYYYVVSMNYMRQVLKTTPAYSPQGYASYVGKIAWKYIRPILWLLLPFVGPILYIRSILRYELVGPLTLLDRKPELKRSWDLTKSQCWRIFGCGIVLVICVALPFTFLNAIIQMIGIVEMIGDPNVTEASSVIMLFSAVVKSLGCTIAQAIYALFPFAVYSVLAKEATSKPATT